MINRLRKELQKDIIMDSAATSHFSGNRCMFVCEIKPYSHKTEYGSGTLPIRVIGIIVIEVEYAKV